MEEQHCFVRGPFIPSLGEGSKLKTSLLFVHGKFRISRHVVAHRQDL